VLASGENLKQVFANAAKGMFSLITDLRKVKTTYRKEINITAPDKESLLVAWLNELIYTFDVEQLLFKKFDIIKLTDNLLRAIAWGEKVDSNRHPIKLGIKSTTYHMLEIKKNQGYHAKIFFDI